MNSMWFDLWRVGHLLCYYLRIDLTMVVSMMMVSFDSVVLRLNGREVLSFGEMRVLLYRLGDVPRRR